METVLEQDKLQSDPLYTKIIEGIVGIAESLATTFMSLVRLPNVIAKGVTALPSYHMALEGEPEIQKLLLAINNGLESNTPNIEVFHYMISRCFSCL